MDSNQSFSLTNLNRAFPSWHQLLTLTLMVLLAHVWLLMTSGDSLWRLHSESQKLGPLQTRVIATANTSPAVATNQPPASKSANKPYPSPPKTSSLPSSVAAQTPAGMSAVTSAALPEPVSPTETASQPSQETRSAPNPPALPTEVPIGLSEKAADTTPQPAPQDNALVAKAGSFPDNVQINYRLTGQERGLNYYASGFLKWQVKTADSSPRTYEAELRVRAFLIGSRVWRSQGVLMADGLAPKRYSDSWRGEKAAHFDAALGTISFSGNSPSAVLQPGAQDQVSLFIQMAAAVAAQNFKSGTELNIQTATARDAVNWRLIYKSDDAIEVKGQRLETQRWVCLPRGKYDSQIEMWLSKSHGGMPVRIKITQVSGNFIDLEMSSTEALGPLTD
jgi:hypothetical protein